LIATLDGDGQNDPADIPGLLKVFNSPDSPAGLQLVIGHRRKRQDSWVKRGSARVANKVRGYLLKDRTPDTGCGLKLFPRNAFLELPFFDHMHRFLPALIQRSGGAVLSVEVNHRPRKHGISHYGIWDRLWVGLVDLLGVMWLRRRSKTADVEEVRNFET
jgi:dolichol-phosphate mannosyltransferase